jgi:predicted DNA binding CopG/RHH family protein
MVEHRTPTRVMSFRASHSDLAALQAEAARRGLTQSELIRQSLLVAGVTAGSAEKAAAN